MGEGGRGIGGAGRKKEKEHFLCDSPKLPSLNSVLALLRAGHAELETSHDPFQTVCLHSSVVILCLGSGASELTRLVLI